MRSKIPAAVQVRDGDHIAAEKLRKPHNSPLVLFLLPFLRYSTFPFSSPSPAAAVWTTSSKSGYKQSWHQNKVSCYREDDRSFFFLSLSAHWPRTNCVQTASAKQSHKSGGCGQHVHSAYHLVCHVTSHHLEVDLFFDRVMCLCKVGQVRLVHSWLNLHVANFDPLTVELGKTLHNPVNCH